MDYEKLVATVTAEVLRQLSAMSGEPPAGPRYRALAVFTGGTIGFETGLQQLQQLQSQDTGLTVVLSAAAEQVLDTGRILQVLGAAVPLVTSTSPYPGQALQAADVLLIPVLTQNSAAKLAHTLADSMALTLILQALQLGKPVIAAVNAADPDDIRRVQNNMARALPALRAALASNLKQIAAYGIKLTPVEKMAGAAQAALARAIDIKPGAADPPAGKRILHADMVKDAAAAGTKTLEIARGTIVTPLARDIARALHVDLIVK